MKQKLQTNPILVIFFTLFINALGFGILIPVIPQLLANPHSSFFLLPAGWSLNQGFILLGFLTAIFPLMQFLATPILGHLSDRYGRKPILAISLIGTFLSYLLFAWGIVIKNIPLLFLSRAFDGITGGNISVAQASIADITTPQNRAKNFGLIGAAFGLGFILGPYIGGKLSDPTILGWFNAATPFWFASILALINTLLVWFVLPETVVRRDIHEQLGWSDSIKNIIKAFSVPSLRGIFTTVFLFIAGFGFFTTFFSVFLIRRFNFTQGNIGDFFSYVGLWIVITQAVITRRAARIFSEAQIVSLSLYGTGFCLFLYFFPSLWWQLLLITPFFAIFNGLSQANITALVSHSVGPERQGEILGINASVAALAQAIPPMISGFIAVSISPEAPVFVSSVVIILAGISFWLLYLPAHRQAIV